MRKFSVVVMLLAITGCKFDTGSRSYTKSIGQTIPLECFKAHLKNVAGLAVGTETSSSMELVAPGITISIEYESADAVVKSYSVATKTERSEDGHIHHTVSSAITQPCSG